MKKISMIGATLMVAAMLSAAPISLQSHDKGLSLSLDRANARLGRPLTPVSVAGVHREGGAALRARRDLLGPHAAAYRAGEYSGSV